MIEKQLDIYKYEQEKLRTVDLKKAYEAEEASAKDLEARILALREKVALRKKELARLQEERRKLDEKKREAGKRKAGAEEAK